jgi:tRNA-2-methylthio-N6-dimethylallyladenosine synthase
MNKSDSERISAVLENMNFRETPDVGRADLIVVNACSVRQSAVDRIWGKTNRFAKLRAKNPKLKTILTGCILKEDKKKFSGQFDLIFDIKNLPKLPQLINKNLPPQFIASSAAAEKPSENYLKIQPNYQTDFRAFVPIMTGCNNFCTYCAVPYTRGREWSRPTEEIICEIKNLAERGYKEIWLLGENVLHYSPRDGNKIKDFSDLLKTINNIAGDFWIRFTSPHPNDFSEKLIEVMAECPKVTEYLNLPVQSGDNEILKKMGRSYTVEYYKNLVKKIRKKIPEIALSTDVIVGFPGETKKQFENTLKLFEDIKFDMAYIAQYSPRPGTTAAKLLKDNVSHQEKEKREKILTGVLKKTALENNKRYLGKTMKILVEKIKGGSGQKTVLVFGKTRTQKTVKVPVFGVNDIGNLVGQFIEVEIKNALPWGLKGQINWEG